MHQTKKLDLHPGTRDLVVIVVASAFVFDNKLLQTLSGLDITTLVLIRVVLCKLHDKRGDGKSNTHVCIIHDGNDALCPLGLYNAGGFAVET